MKKPPIIKVAKFVLIIHLFSFFLSFLFTEFCQQQNSVIVCMFTQDYAFSNWSQSYPTPSPLQHTRTFHHKNTEYFSNSPEFMLNSVHKGTMRKASRDFQLQDFSWISVSPGPLSILLGPFQFFSKIHGDIHQWMFISGVYDSGCKRERFWGIHCFHNLLRAYVGALYTCRLNFCLFFIFRSRQACIVSTVLSPESIYRGVVDTSNIF